MTGPEEGPFDAVAPLLAERQELAARWREALDAVQVPEGLEPEEAYRVRVEMQRKINRAYLGLAEALFLKIRTVQFQADERRYGSPRPGGFHGGRPLGLGE